MAEAPARAPAGGGVRFWLLGPVWLWLGALVAAPLAILLGLALSWQAQGVPPVAPFWRGEGINADNFALILGDPFYRDAFAQSLVLAGGTAALCVLIALPMALAVARARRPALMLALVVLPLWCGLVLRAGAWIGLLRDEGWVNNALRWLGWIEAPVPLLYGHAALYLGMVSAYLPFAVLPLVAAFARLDPAIEEAATDLGAGRTRAFLDATLPRAWPGVAAAFLLVLIPAAGEYVVPELLGPQSVQPAGRALFAEFFANRDWPVAAALAMALLVLLLAPLLVFQRLNRAGDGRP